MSSLLIHSELVPESARNAIRAASALSGKHRLESLKSAARALHVEGNIDCGDALELVGLSDYSCGAC